MPRRKRRTFTAEFKAGVVLDLISGKRSHAELCRDHQLSPSLLSLGKETFTDRLPLLFDGEERHSQDQARIAPLEQLLGRQALELELLKKASRLLPGPAAASGRPSGASAKTTPLASSAACSTSRAASSTAPRLGPASRRRPGVRPGSAWPGSGPPTATVA